MYLAHHGIAGQKWGVQNGPPYPLGSDSKASSLQKQMRSFKYTEFTKLQSPEETAKKKSGSCHDQVLYELKKLKEAGLDPKAKFLINVDDKGQGYQTHSFAYYKEGGKIKWFENAWEDQRGIKSFNSEKEMTNYIEKLLNVPKGITTEWGDFVPEEHETGESLQDLVNKCLK